MTLRSFMALGALAILMGINGFLLYKEYTWHDEYKGIAPPEFKKRIDAVKGDPLQDLKPIKANRQANLEAMGLTPEMVKKALKKMDDLDETQGERFRILLDDVDPETELIDALCGQTQDVRPRYGALRLMVEDIEGKRMPIKLARATGIKRQSWSKVAPIDEVYRQAELGEERQPDATLMAVASILLNREPDLLEGRRPFGRSLASSWSWKTVVSESPGIEDRAVDYFTLMHLAWEYAAGAGGLCGQ